MADDEHPDGARITLEYNEAWPAYVITCGIYGSMMHTRFFTGEDEARREYAAMRAELAQIASLKAAQPGSETSRLSHAIADFQERFP
jgi:hypothetical protein